MNIPSTITIDGPASSGKSTIGQMLAQHLDYLYLDTGCLYRAVTVVSLRRGKPVDQEKTISNLAANITIDIKQPTVEDGRQYTVIANEEDVTSDLRTPEVDASVSIVSAYSGVRQILTKQMRTIGQRGRVVMVGRDIGTIVLPNAGMKLYLDASLSARALRRHNENLRQSLDSRYQEVLCNLRNRDLTDSHRDYAPLRIAPDAHVIDTTRMSPDDVLAEIMSLLSTEINCKRDDSVGAVHV